MKEHPLLFSTPMVRALLLGTKTQTRRLVKPQPPMPQATYPARWRFNYWAGSPFNSDKARDPERFELVDGIGNTFTPKRNYGKPGDRIYVRESGWVDNNYMPGLNEGHCYWKADELETWELELVKAHYDRFPSIHMPKDLARIWLEITGVRVEPLWQITEQDAKEEGARRGIFRDGPNTERGEFQLEDNGHASYLDGFKFIWMQINGRASWEQNPLVWVINFKVLSINGKP